MMSVRVRVSRVMLKSSDFDNVGILFAVRFAIIDQKKVKFSHDKLLPDNAKGTEANEPRCVCVCVPVCVLVCMCVCA